MPSAAPNDPDLTVLDQQVSEAPHLCTREGILDRYPETGGVNGRKAVQLGLDQAELPSHLPRLRHPAREQLVHVFEVLLVAALDLRQRLGHGVEVVKVDPALPGDEGAFVLPIPVPPG
jgi:hypothetical protein